MRSSRIVLSLTAAALMTPISAHALVIQFCTPDCTIPIDQQVTVSSVPSQTVTDLATSTTTTTIPIPTFAYGPFTITATVSSQQSGTLQKISFNPTAITANTGTLCSGTAPCHLQVIATSDANDFPLPKPTGGYPAGVYMMGSFGGTEAVGNGDTIAMVGTASSLIPVASDTGTTSLTAVAGDVINTTPGTGPGNIGVSLPSSCTGNPACAFMASTLKKAFSTQISETVQQTCGLDPLSPDYANATCRTQLKTQLDVFLKTPGNRVSLPLDYITTNVNPSQPNVNPTELLVQKLAPQFGGVDVNQLSVFPTQFSMTANLTLNAGDTIDPTTEEVFLRVADYSATILPGGFKRLANGKMYKFTGKIDGREVVVSVSNEGSPQAWKFVADVHQVQVTGVPLPPLQTPVEIGIGSNIGSDLVTARFFGK
jgi:hypothetical protein